MKWVDFFIDRPVTATIINLMLMVCGVLAFRGLLVDEYPVIVVPKLSIRTTFPNASAETVEKEITNPIEEALARVEGLQEISSRSNSGRSQIYLTFQSSVSMDKATLQVSEQLSRVRERLPKEVLPSELSRSGDNDSPIFYLAVRSKEIEGAALTHFANTHIKSHFQGIDGVSAVQVYGRPYLMNVVIDPLAMHSQNINPDDISKVLKQNELLLSAGRLKTMEPINLDVVPQSADDYRQMIIGENGETPVFLDNVADVYLSEDTEGFSISIAGEKAVFLGVVKASDGNILKIAKAIKDAVPQVNDELRGKAYVTVESDKSIFVSESLRTIYQTIAEACILVLLIILCFLRNLRLTMVPLVTIPISLVATFFALRIFGLTINTITLLAMVLSVGLVVDDAIVVLENIFRYREQGLSAYEAAKKGAREIGFAIIAMTGTLISVFLPLVFVADVTGMILREFAITLASAVFFSGVVALTLTPLMSSYFLKKVPNNPNKLSQMLERGIDRIEHFYAYTLTQSLRLRYYFFGALGIILCVGFFLGSRLKNDLVPKEDRGMVGAYIPMMPGYSLADMGPYVAQVESIFFKYPEAQQVLTASGTWGTEIVVPLKPWRERKLHSEKILEKIRNEIVDIPSVVVHPWSWDLGLDALRSGGNGQGIMVTLKTAGSYEQLEGIGQKLVERLNKENVLKDVRKDLNMDQKSLRIKINREAMQALGIDEKSLSIALQTYADRMSPSEFKMDGQRYQVQLQSAFPIEDLSSIYLRSKNGMEVPLAAFAEINEEMIAPELSHWNQMRSATVSANLAPGQSLGEAKDYIEKVVTEEVPDTISVSYEGALAMQRHNAQTFLMLFIAGLIFIFAILAIQFEALIDPLIILITVPMASVGAIFLLWLSGNNTNLYTQVGMLTLIGLITKHGILLTEFVGNLRQQGKKLEDAVKEATILRFRPILMTTLATVLGAIPLIISRGAGVEARASIGIVIVGGMIFGTLLTLYILPGIIFTVHFYKDKWLSKKRVTPLVTTVPNLRG